MGARGVVGDRAGLGLPGSGRRAGRSRLRHDRQQRDPATGKPITLSVNCFDAAGDTVTLTHSTPAHGTLSVFVRNAQTGFFDATYTPSGSYTGPDSFSFQAHAGSLNSATFGFDLIITENHAPHCDTNGTFHAKVGETITIGFFCTDQDTQDQHLTYTPISAPAHGTLSNQQDFQVDYTPTAG